MAVLVALAAFAFVDQEVRVGIGAVCQVGGTVAVVWGVYQTARSHFTLSSGAYLRSWIARRPKFRPLRSASVEVAPRVDEGSGDWKLPSVVGGGFGHDGTVEGRITMLESRLEQVVESINGLKSHHAARLDELTDGLSREGANREDGIGEIRSQMRHNDLSGLRNSLAGAVWVVAGIILSTPWRDVVG